MEGLFLSFHRVLSLAGISIFRKESWNSRFWLYLQILNVLLGFCSFVFSTGYLVDSISDLPAFIKGACIWTTGVIMFISLIICLIFRSKFRRFLLEMGFRDAIIEIPLINYLMNVEPNGKKLKELKNMVMESQDELLKYTGLLLKVYVASVFITATLYICGAIFQMLTQEDQSNRILAFEMWFPWSLDDLRVYSASFLFHAYTGYLCCVAYPGLQSTIILLVGQMIRQLRILTFIMENLDTLAQELTLTQQGREWQECCTAVMAQCIRHYVLLKRFGNRLNAICRPFYLTLILVAIMLVCVCSVKIAISRKLSPDVIKYYVHEFCFITMVLMFCTLGQQIQNECEKIQLAILERWYIYDKKHKQHLRIFHMAALQKMPISIFGSVTLSLPTFTWFIRTGTSFFTLMMSFLDAQ